MQTSDAVAIVGMSLIFGTIIFVIYIIHTKKEPMMIIPEQPPQIIKV